MKKAKFMLLLLVLTLLSAAAFSGCSKPEAIAGPGDTGAAKPAAIADRPEAPTFTLKELSTGADVEFKSDAGGRVRMVTFFSPG